MKNPGQTEQGNAQGSKGKATKQGRKRGQGEGSIYKRKDGLWVGAAILAIKTAS